MIVKMEKYTPKSSVWGKGLLVILLAMLGGYLVFSNLKPFLVQLTFRKKNVLSFYKKLASPTLSLEARERNFRSGVYILKKEIEKNPLHPEALFMLGKFYFIWGKISPVNNSEYLKSALRNLLSAYTISYKKKQIAAWVFRTYLELGRQYRREARYFWDRCDKTGLPEREFLEAKLLFFEKNYSRAVELLENLLREKPRHYQAMFLLADCFLELENFEEAEKLFKEIEKNYPPLRREALQRIKRIYHLKKEAE